jgi:glucokinase
MRRSGGKQAASPRLPLRAEAARPAQLRESNCRLLLRLLRSSSPCSKADLVRNSGLSATTVSVSIAHMTKLGLVEELGDGESSGGRPPSLLQFHGGHGLVAGADVGGTRLRMMLADLNGRPVAQWATHLGERQKTPRAIVSLMQTGIREMVRQAEVSARVLHLTVGAPGITDVEHGVVLAAPNLQGWTDFPMRALVEREMKVPCTVENDVNLAAVGEHARGEAQGVQDFIFIALGTGIGAGIYLRGALHHGADWSAGEIGYLPVLGMPREPVRLEQTGQLERAIGGAGVEAMWQKALRRERRSGNAELMQLHAPQVFDLADEGHALAAEVTTATARILADAVGTLSLLYNPEVVVLGGGVGRHRTLCSATEAFLRENEFAQPKLRASSLGAEAQLFGAVSLSLSAAEAGLLC